MVKQTNRGQKIERAIELTWISLKSHLDGAYGKVSKRYSKEVGSNKFHQQCIKDYAETIKILSDLY